MDYATVKRISYELGIDEYYRYLPILFTYRTINTTKPLGAKGDPEEKKFLLENNEGNLEKIGHLLQKLPTDLVFIFKAMLTMLVSLSFVKVKLVMVNMVKSMWLSFCLFCFNARKSVSLFLSSTIYT